MNDYFSFPTGHVIAQIEVVPNRSSGSGRAELPVLHIPLQLNLHCPKSPGLSIDFREIRCRISPFDGPYLAESRPVVLNVRIESGNDLSHYLAALEIPLDRARLAFLNRLRNGGDVGLRLDLELHADELVEISRTGQGLNTSVWGIKAHHCMCLPLPTVIPRSIWAEQVLPGTGFAKVHIIELPAVPIESCAGLKASFDALVQAQKLESQGLYLESMGKCRAALEPFFESADKTDAKGDQLMVPTLKAAWQTGLGQETYRWLNAVLGGLQAPAMPPASKAFEQLEAQMLLNVTTAVVAYAIKTQPEETA